MDQDCAKKWISQIDLFLTTFDIKEGNRCFCQKPEKNYFLGSKWIAGNILCIVFFSISEDAFILCISFFTDSGRCFLRPKLSILYSMYPILIKYASENIYVTIELKVWVLARAQTCDFAQHGFMNESICGMINVYLWINVCIQRDPNCEHSQGRKHMWVCTAWVHMQKYL